MCTPRDAAVAGEHVHLAVVGTRLVEHDQRRPSRFACTLSNLSAKPHVTGGSVSGSTPPRSTSAMSSVVRVFVVRRCGRHRGRVAAVADEHRRPVERSSGRSEIRASASPLVPLAVAAGGRAARSRSRRCGTAPKSSSAVSRNWLSCENSPWWALPSGVRSEPGSSGSSLVELGVVDEHRVGRVADVHLDVAGVPVVALEDRLAVDLLHDHVVVQDDAHRWPARRPGSPGTAPRGRDRRPAPASSGS